jgi:hypothetical protein
VLIPDFQGNWDALDTVMQARPEVLNHNIETVPRLYRRVRPQAIYAQSLELLERAGAYGTREDEVRAHGRPGRDVRRGASPRWTTCARTASRS